MNRLKMFAMCLLALMATSLSVKAQEITITLNHGWNWISYPNAVSMEIGEAMGDFVPMEGDVIKSQFGFAEYSNGQWIGGFTHFMPGKGYVYYSSRSEMASFVFAQAASTAVATATPTDVTAVSAVVGGMVMLPEGSHVFLRGVCWGTGPNPTIDDNHITIGTGIGSFSDTLTELTPGITYYIRAYVVSDYGLAYGNQQSFTTVIEYQYVDLGLPSGTLWATFNVGASSPEGYGDYFAWGETQPKDDFSWGNYQYSNGGNSDYPNLTKYCNIPGFGYNGFTDNLTILEPSDDAAMANWGSDWRMPTMEEWWELYQNTTYTNTIQNGVNGRLFTAPNGNSVFFPAADYPGGGFPNGAGGSYWSSSLYTDYPGGACYLMFDSNNNTFTGFNLRCNGSSVRPVRSTPQSNVPTGAINGKFTINEDGDQVYFSQGNLQYQASTNTWKFADNQYDYVGSTNSNISSTYSGWIDLFGWGTSGYNHGANCYQPWITSQTNSDYYAYGSYTYNLYDQTGQADWGYNPISNGGNQTNQWRTLTNPEWNYVFNTRSTTSGIRYAKANVNNVNGVILLPDDWSTSTYSLSSTNTYNASFSSNTLTASEWSTLEQAGAVFLPAVGFRNGTSVYDVGSGGNYWSASYSSSYYARYVYFIGSDLSTNGLFRSYGFSVRLARVAE